MMTINHADKQTRNNICGFQIDDTPTPKKCTKDEFKEFLCSKEMQEYLGDFYETDKFGQQVYSEIEEDFSNVTRIEELIFTPFINKIHSQIADLCDENFGKFCQYEKEVKGGGKIDILYTNAVVENQLGNIDYDHYCRLSGKYMRGLPNRPGYMIGTGGVADGVMEEHEEKTTKVNRTIYMIIAKLELKTIDGSTTGDDNSFIVDINHPTHNISFTLVSTTPDVSSPDDSTVKVLCENFKLSDDEDLIKNFYEPYKNQPHAVKSRVMNFNVPRLYEKKVLDGESQYVSPELRKKHMSTMKQNLQKKYGQDWQSQSKLLVLWSIEYLYDCDMAGIDMSTVTLVIDSEKDEGRLYLAKQLGVSSFIIADNILKKEINMQDFDFKIGNPPFQYPKHGDDGGKDTKSKLYIDISKKLLKQDGEIILITPSNILKEKGSIGEAFRDRLCSVDFTADKFFNISQNVISWHCTEKGNKPPHISVTHSTGKVVNVKDVNDVVDGENGSEQLILKSLFDKLDYTKYDTTDQHGLPIDVKSMKMPISQVTKKTGVDNKLLSTTSTAEYSMPVRCNTKGTPIQYCKPTDAVHDGSTRVVIPYAGRYEDGVNISSDELNYFYFINDIELTDKEKYNMLTILNSKLYSVAIEKYNSTAWQHPQGTHNLLFRVAKPGVNGLKHNWSDKELYAYFELTDDEINYIENESTTCKRYVNK